MHRFDEPTLICQNTMENYLRGVEATEEEFNNTHQRENKEKSIKGLVMYSTTMSTKVNIGYSIPLMQEEYQSKCTICRRSWVSQVDEVFISPL